MSIHILLQQNLTGNANKKLWQKHIHKGKSNSNTILNNIKDGHQTTGEKNKKGTEEKKKKTYKNKPKTIEKIKIGTQISIITVSVNGLNVPTKRLSKRDITKTIIQAIYKRHTSGLWKQTESEGMEKDIPGKWKSKEGWNTNTRIRKIKQTLK